MQVSGKTKINDTQIVDVFALGENDVERLDVQMNVSFGMNVMNTGAYLPDYCATFGFSQIIILNRETKGDLVECN